LSVSSSAFSEINADLSAECGTEAAAADFDTVFYSGIFHLVDSWREPDTHRTVFKFKLAAVEGEEDFDVPVPVHPVRRRVIPTQVKLEVWQRDGGKCVMCGATDELHFDHDLPYSKGGSSITAKNVQLLCARHNLQKHDHIT
jgi:hypothetical protein